MLHWCSKQADPGTDCISACRCRDQRWLWPQSSISAWTPGSTQPPRLQTLPSLSAGAGAALLALAARQDCRQQRIDEVAPLTSAASVSGGSSCKAHDVASPTDPTCRRCFSVCCSKASLLAVAAASFRCRSRLASSACSSAAALSPTCCPMASSCCFSLSRVPQAEVSWVCRACFSSWQRWWAAAASRFCLQPHEAS